MRRISCCLHAKGSTRATPACVRDCIWVLRRQAQLDWLITRDPIAIPRNWMRPFAWRYGWGCTNFDIWTGFLRHAILNDSVDLVKLAKRRAPPGL